MRQILLAAAAVTLLAACAGPSPEEIAAADDARCAEYGFPAGHPDYGNCRFALDQMRFQAEQAKATNALAAASQLGAMQQIYRTQPATSAAPVNCYQNSMGWTCW